MTSQADVDEAANEALAALDRYIALRIKMAMEESAIQQGKDPGPQ